MTRTYSLSKTCKTCQHRYNVVLSKIEAAFTVYRDKLEKTAQCPKCHNTGYSSSAISPPKIDEELMAMWATQEDLWFADQDEDLWLVDNDILELNKRFILNADTLADKRHRLISALCVMVYDKSPGSKEALAFLKENLSLVEQAKSYIDKYIAQKVFPKLGLRD